jgi:sugar phosphate isomerase/epimerase
VSDREIQFSFSTLACPDWTWADLLTFGPQFGYDGVEIRLLRNETNLLALPEFAADQLPIRRRELADAGFVVCGLASSVRFDDLQPAEREKQLALGRAYVDMAVELGTPFVRVFGDTVPEVGDPRKRQASIEWVAEGLQQLGEYAAGVGVRILMETHGDFSDSLLMHDTMSLVESAAVGVLWDTHHPWRFFGETLAESFKRLQPWIQHTHWKDSVSRPERRAGDSGQAAASRAHSLMSGHRHADYVLFGGGEFPAGDCMRLLIESNYTGWYSLEWEKAWHPELESPEIALPLFPPKLRRLHEVERTRS